MFKWRTFELEVLSSQDLSLSPTREQVLQAAEIWRTLAQSYRVWSIAWLFWGIVGLLFALQIALTGFLLQNTLKIQLRFLPEADAVSEHRGINNVKPSIINGAERAKFLK